MRIHKIQIVARLPGYIADGRVCGGGGVCPTIRSRDWKDPIRILVRDDGQEQD